MAGEDNIPNPLTEMDPQRQQSARPGFPFGQAPYPGGQVDSYSVYDIREEFDARDEKAAADELAARKSEMVRVQRSLEIGDLVAPNSDTFGGFKAIHDYRLVGETGVFPVQFNPFQFGIFDGKIAQAMEGDDLHNGPLSNAAHEDYPKYQDLRRNIAILRNILYVQCFGRDGYQSFVPQDYKNMQKIEKMAEMLGDALAKGKNGSAPFFNSLSVAEASVPDKGVATMYNYLCQVEKQPWHRPMRDNISSVFSGDVSSSYDWNMRPIEETPLAPAYMKMNELGIEPFIQYQEDTPGKRMTNLGVQMDYTRAQLTVPQMLDKPVRDEAIYLAMKILKGWKVKAGTNPQNANLAMNEADELEQMQRICDMSIIYKDKYSQLLLGNPALANDPYFATANDAMTKLTYMIKQQAFEELNNEGNKDSVQIMAELRDRMPRSHRPQPGETFDVLVDRLAQGLAHAANLRGLPGPWLRNSPGAAITSLQSTQHQQQVVDNQQHNQSMAMDAIKQAAAQMQGNAYRDTNMAKVIDGNNPTAALQNRVAQASIAGVNSQAAKKIVDKAVSKQQALADERQRQLDAMSTNITKQ